MSNQPLAIKVLNDYPIATEIAREWFIKKMKQNLDEDLVDENFKEFMLRKGVPDDTLAIMLDQNPRTFFDVLDENRLFIEIRMSEEAEGGFYYIINSVEDNQIYDNRISCERAAVIKAFERLN
jgi:hypothetical protein